jgi:hypothetical protein
VNSTEETQVDSVEAFEICQAIKGKADNYTLVDEGRTVQETFSNWEAVYIRFRDGSGAC